jgi:flagellar basal-body rod protein FlgF
VNSGIYTAYSGLRAQMNALDILSNNLANVNTTGFKEEKPFYTLLNETMQPAEGGEVGTVINNQTVLSRGALNVANGSLNLTGRDLDVALTGNGFLTVQAPQGVRYTRNGSLVLNSKSALCTADGFPVLGEKGTITLGPGKITVNTQGEVFLNDSRVDKLKTASFQNPAGLLREGSSLLTPSSGQTAQPATELEIKQGYLEQSNVNPVSSIVGLVGIMRQFESIQRSFNLLVNDINQKSIEKLGR